MLNEFDCVTDKWKTYTPQMLISICHSKEQCVIISLTKGISRER